MGKRLLISEDEKLIIRSLHNTLKEKENYFQIQENKIKSIIMEQTGELPSLRQGETRDEEGKMVTNKTENIAPLNIEIDAKFAPGVTGPYTPSEEDLKKLEELVNWLSSDFILNKKVDIKVNSGSSKTGNFEQNKRLAIDRGKTGIEFIKDFLKDRISQEVFNNIVFPEPTDELANQGPEKGLYPNDSEMYRNFQKFKIVANVSGQQNIKTERKVKINIYRDNNQLMGQQGSGFKYIRTNWMPENFAEVFKVPLKEIESLLGLKENKSGYNLPSRQFGFIPSFGYIGFCNKGFINEFGKYNCPEDELGFRSNYIYNGNFPGRRWLPYRGELSTDLNPNVSEILRSVMNPTQASKDPNFNKPGAGFCFMAENPTNPLTRTKFFERLSKTEYCQSLYSQWDATNYRYKYDINEVPGPESAWFKDIQNSVWYQRPNNGGLWKVPGKSETTR